MGPGHSIALCAILVFLSITASAQPEHPSAVQLDVEALPALPHPHGLSGMYGGVSNGVLVLAGGVSMISKPDGSGFEKEYNDRIFVLPSKDEGWIAVNQRLPRSLAHGVSVSYDNPERGISGVICAGGLNSNGYYKDVFLLEWDQGDVNVTKLPSLPGERAYASGGLLNNCFHIAGGTSGTQDQDVFRDFWMLDLSLSPDQEQQWEELDPWPGNGRHSPMATVQYGGFFLLGGLRFSEDSVLADAYEYKPGVEKRKGVWTRITNIPSSIAFAPAPVFPLGQSHIAVIGPSNAGPLDPAEDSLNIITYHAVTDAWTRHGLLPNGYLRTYASIIGWKGGFVIAGGQEPFGNSSNQVDFIQLEPQKGSFTWLDWSVLILYLLVLIWIGFYFSKREKGTDDYFLGGRRVPWWAAGLSIIGTGLSAISYMGSPAVVFETDLVRIVATLMYVPASVMAIYFFLPFYRRLNVTTAYQYLELRFNVAVRMFVSGIFIAAQLGRMAVVVYLPALALSAVTGIDVYLCIGIMGLLSILYTVLGGIEAVIWTDVFQVVILYLGAIVCVIFIILKVGGLTEVVEIGMAGNKFRMAIWTWDYTVMAIYIMVLGNLVGLFVSYGSDQSYVQRYLTTPTERDAGKSILTSGILPILSSPIFTLFGVSLWAFYKTHPELLYPGNNDALVPTFIAQMLPPGISGLIIAGIFAASMSSLDSGMHSAATAYVTDFHKRIWTKIDDHFALKIARWVTGLLGLVGTSFSFFMIQAKQLPIFDTWTLLANLIVGGYGGAFILGVFTKRANGRGTFIGIFFGALVPYLAMTYTHIIFYAWPFIAITSCVTTGYLASLLLPDKKSKKDLAGLTIYTLNQKKA